MKLGHMLFGVVLSVALGTGVVLAGTDKDQGGPQTVPQCPVMDEPANLAISVPTDDGPVFFCCGECPAKYQAQPAKYAAKVAAQRKALADRPSVQVTCPVTKEPVDNKVFVESGGRKVFFCCKECVGKYEADPAKYAAALANSFTYQTKCPVSNEAINPKAFTIAANGMKVYLCCKDCDKKFQAEPAKYTPNLAAQGFNIEPEKGGQGQSPDKKGHDHGADDHSGHGHDH